MSHLKKALMIDLDGPTMVLLRQALPNWTIQKLPSASTTALAPNEDVEAADLLVMGVQDDVSHTLALCRGLRRESGRAGPPLLVLVPADQPGLVQQVRDAGADDCMVLPIEVEHLRALVEAFGSSADDAAVDGLQRAQPNDRWHDEGGQG